VGCLPAASAMAHSRRVACIVLRRASVSGQARETGRTSDDNDWEGGDCTANGLYVLMRPHCYLSVLVVVFSFASLFIHSFSLIVQVMMVII
jgi:hypothetical protein